IREEVESIVDAIGKPIDKGIFETVVYLNALGIPTTQSCEGHADSGRPWPWVRIGADNEPRERFVGQLKTYQQVADENNVQLSVVERAQNVELWAEAERRIGDVPETDEYQEWANKNSQLVNQVQVLIDEFYADRKVEDDLKLELMVMAGNEAELM